MLTIITAGILDRYDSSERSNIVMKENNSKTEISEIETEERIRREKYDKIENFTILLPLIIMTMGIIIMYILDKIFSK